MMFQFLQAQTAGHLVLLGTCIDVDHPQPVKIAWAVVRKFGGSSTQWLLAKEF